MTDSGDLTRLTASLLVQDEPARGLAALGLSAAELDALAQQGFVAAENRCKRGPYYKLRFRVGGRQVVRYLGCDPALAEQVRQDVRALQTDRRRAEQLNRATKEAWSTLRRIKKDLQQPLAAAGFAFHGLEIRKERAVPQPSAARSAPSD